MHKHTHSHAKPHHTTKFTHAAHGAAVGDAQKEDGNEPNSSLLSWFKAIAVGKGADPTAPAALPRDIHRISTPPAAASCRSATTPWIGWSFRCSASACPPQGLAIREKNNALRTRYHDSNAGFLVKGCRCGGAPPPTQAPAARPPRA